MLKKIFVFIFGVMLGGILMGEEKVDTKNQVVFNVPASNYSVEQGKIDIVDGVEVVNINVTHNKNMMGMMVITKKTIEVKDLKGDNFKVKIHCWKPELFKNINKDSKYEFVETISVRPVKK